MTAADDMQFGKLVRVDLREVWKSEAGGFTPWIAKAENLTLLGEALGMNLAEPTTETRVGKFRADLVCRDAATGRKVLIENQLVPSNHKHLGQLITYAADLDAEAIVWVAEKFAMEHWKGIDWLNSHTSDKLSFFAVEVEAHRIGNSPIAVEFKIVREHRGKVEKLKKARNVKRKNDIAPSLTETKKKNREYWNRVSELMKVQCPEIPSSGPRAKAGMHFTLGSSRFGMHASAVTKRQYLRVGFCCFGKERFEDFDWLKQQQNTIEAEIGESLTWERMGHNKNECRIGAYKWEVNPMDSDDWPRQHEWIIKRLIAFYKVFRPLVEQRRGRG